MDEGTAKELVERAVEQSGGARHIVASPRHPFGRHPYDEIEIDGTQVRIRYGEMSAPAIAEVAGWIFEIREHELVTLDHPRPGRGG
jgi:hypothetical protein